MFSRVMQPGESLEFPASGQHVRVDKGSKVHIKTDMNEIAPVYERDSVTFKSFNNITITFQGVAAELVEVRVSDGRIVSAGDGAVMAISSQGNGVTLLNPEAIALGSLDVTVGDVGITGEVVSKNVATTLADVPDIPVAAGQSATLSVANANRQELIIQAVGGDQLSHARIGGSTVATGRGLKIYGGNGVEGSLTLNSSGLVRVYNEGPEQMTFSVVEVNR